MGFQFKGVEIFLYGLVITALEVKGQAYTGVDDQVELNFNIYPNPTTDAIYLDLQQVQHAELKLLSLDGRVAKDFGIRGGEGISLGVADLRSGIYLLQVVIDDERHLQKVILLPLERVLLFSLVSYLLVMNVPRDILPKTKPIC